MSKINGKKLNKNNLVFALMLVALLTLSIGTKTTLAACNTSLVCGSYIDPGGRNYSYGSPTSASGYSTGNTSTGSTSGSYQIVTATAETGNPVPEISSINPASVAPGSDNMIVNITGSNFIPGSVARWNSSNRDTTYIDQNHLAIAISQKDLSGQGQYLITVFNPAPGGGYSNSAVFTLGQGSATSVTSAGASTSGAEVLTASAGKSGSSFFPSSFTGWILIAILILFIVMIWRKIYLNEKKKNEKAREEELAAIHGHAA